MPLCNDTLMPSRLVETPGDDFAAEYKAVHRETCVVAELCRDYRSVSISSLNKGLVQPLIQKFTCIVN